MINTYYYYEILCLMHKQTYSKLYSLINNKWNVKYCNIIFLNLIYIGCENVLMRIDKICIQITIFEYY